MYWSGCWKVIFISKFAIHPHLTSSKHLKHTHAHAHTRTHTRIYARTRTFTHTATFPSPSLARSSLLSLLAPKEVVRLRMQQQHAQELMVEEERKEEGGKEEGRGGGKISPSYLSFDLLFFLPPFIPVPFHIHPLVAFSYYLFHPLPPFLPLFVRPLLAPFLPPSPLGLLHATLLFPLLQDKDAQLPTDDHELHFIDEVFLGVVRG